jgi:hypothetical protein
MNQEISKIISKLVHFTSDNEQFSDLKDAIIHQNEIDECDSLWNKLQITREPDSDHYVEVPNYHNVVHEIIAYISYKLTEQHKSYYSENQLKNFSIEFIKDTFDKYPLSSLARIVSEYNSPVGHLCYRMILINPNFNPPRYYNQIYNRQHPDETTLQV